MIQKWNKRKGKGDGEMRINKHDNKILTIFAKTVRSDLENQYNHLPEKRRNILCNLIYIKF